MPLSNRRAIAHLQQAQHNYKLYQELKSAGENLDWAVTVLFYTALHLVEAYLVETGTAFDPPRDHLKRDSLIGLKLRHIYVEYNTLLTRSYWARYRVDKPKPTPQVLQGLEDQEFADIVDELAKLGVNLNPRRPPDRVAFFRPGCPIAICLPVGELGLVYCGIPPIIGLQAAHHERNRAYLRNVTL